MSHQLPLLSSLPRSRPTVQQESTIDSVIELRKTPDTNRPQTELGTSWVSDSAFVDPCKDSRASERVAPPDPASGNARAPLSPAAASLRDNLAGTAVNYPTCECGPPRKRRRCGNEATRWRLEVRMRRGRPVLPLSLRHGARAPGRWPRTRSYSKMPS